MAGSLKDIRWGPLLLIPLLFSGLCAQFSPSEALCGIANLLAVVASLLLFLTSRHHCRRLVFLVLATVLLEWSLLGLDQPALSRLLPLLLGIGQPLALGGILGLLIREWRDPGFPRRPIRQSLLVLLALAGLWGGLAILVWPLVFQPLRNWLKREDQQWRLFFFQIPLLLLCLSPVLSTILLGQEAPAEGRGAIPSALEQVRYWATPAFFQAMLIFTARFILNARIRWKLLSTFGLSSLVPLFILSILTLTMGVVLMGGYRASLVKVQLQERGTVSLMVTRWLMESFEDLRQGSLGDFDAKVQSITNEESLSKVFFGLYLREADTDSTQLWRPLQSSWRMPAGMFSEKLRLPSALPGEVHGGFVLFGGRLYSVSMVRRGAIMGLGYLPVDQELLEDVGSMLGVEVMIRHLRRGELLGYSASHISLVESDVAAKVITNTPSYGEEQDLLERFFSMGMARLEQGALQLGDTEDVFVVHIRTSPGRILASVFSDQGEENLIYLLLMAIQLVVLLPLFLMASWVAFLTGRRITRSVDELHAGTERLSEGDFLTPIPAKTGDELGDLARSFNLMSKRIHESIAHLAEKSRLEKELSIARRIQRDLLPMGSPTVAGLDIAASSIPAREVGGDYYDWREHPAGGWAFSLGDVAGKGVSAAILMADIQAAWSVLVDTRMDAAELALRLNLHLFEDTPDDLFVTHFHGTINEADTAGRLPLCYCNCGHNPPVVLRGDEIIPLDTGGLILGMFDFAEFERGEFMLEPGDLLVLYTDGLTETCNADDEEFGEERLYKVLRGGLPQEADKVLDLLKQRVQDFAGRDGFDDDLTLLVIRVIDGTAP